MNSEVLSPPKVKLTPKQKKFLKVYSETLNATEAAMQAYDCKNRGVAKALGAENLSKLDFQELLNASGLTDDYLAATIKEGTKATKPVEFGGKLQAVADYSVRHKYTETALKLKGRLSDTQKVELTGADGGPLQLQMIAGIGFLNKPIAKVSDKIEDDSDNKNQN